MSNVRARLGALMVAAALAGGMIVAGANPAAAADSFSFTPIGETTGDFYIGIQNNTRNAGAGYAYWQADPASDGTTGDTIWAADLLADGYGIETHLSTGRVASTRGQASPYTVTASGNLPEGNRYTMWVCVVQGTFSKCSSKYTVTA